MLSSMSGSTPARRFVANDVRSDLCLPLLHPALRPVDDVPLPVPTVRELPADGPLPPPQAAERPRHSPVAVPSPDPAEVERERALRQRADRVAEARTRDAVRQALAHERRRQAQTLEDAQASGETIGERRGFESGLRWGVIGGTMAGFAAGALFAAVYLGLWAAA